MESTRITAPIVKKVLDEHLHEHALKWNTKLHDAYHAVLGEQGKGGLCDDVDLLKNKYDSIDKRLAGIEDTLKWLVRLVLGAVILAVLGLVFVK